MYGHDAGRSFSQPRRCAEIRRTNATTLAPAWFVPTADSVTASPAIVGDTAYVGSWDGVMHAININNGRQRWAFHISDANTTAFGRINSSAAVVDFGRTRVVLFGGGATLYALDARTGRLLSSLCLDPRSNPAVRCKGESEGAVEIESSPAVVKRGDDDVTILVGMDVHNEPKVGRTGIVSVRLLRREGGDINLEEQWKFDPEDGGHTYTGTGLLTRGAGTGNGCGGVWGSPAVDVDNDLVFFGTSSCSIDTDDDGESLWGIRLSRGEKVWHFDAHAPGRYPSRHWDDDFGASPNLLPDGLVGCGGKDGWYYALDRKTGSLEWSTRAGQAGHITAGFAVGGMIGSAATGMVKGEPAIFATTAISTPLRAPMDETPFDIDPTLAEDPGRMMSIHAMRASDGAILWRSPFVRASYGAPSFSGGVVFVPSTFDFTVKALDANTGLLLFASPLRGAPSSTPVPLGRMLIGGAGTRTTDVEYKAFGAGALDALLGPSPLAPLSGIYGFRLAS